MADLVSFLSDGLIGASIVVALFALLLIGVYAYVRARQGPPPPERDPRMDLANMMILFQTMRDLLEQQKDLARQLNQSLDRKVAFIKESVDTALDDLAEMRKRVRELGEVVDELRAELNGGQRAPRRPAAAPDRERAGSEEPDERPALNVLALPKAPPATRDVIDNWVGLDFGGDAPDPLLFEVPEEPPGEPEDAEAAREAFRALLNIESALPAGQTGASASPGQEPPARKGNGKGNTTPLQARVCEYSDAGMTVPQIAKELGIGKGEVRLMLSLRGGKGR
ncbi:MAG: hypothetical protein JXR94_04040 [Candidatus Hydrogenedentes bacterium]|nr:hypothetical protein [Candidatus Hydrogenedentota bacterium]